MVNHSLQNICPKENKQLNDKDACPSKLAILANSLLHYIRDERVPPRNIDAFAVVPRQQMQWFRAISLIKCFASATLYLSWLLEQG